MNSQALLKDSTPASGNERLVKRFWHSENYYILKNALAKRGLFTVCQEARCPNISECFARKELTFVMLGRACTRACGFCAVEKGSPGAIDGNEPERISSFIREFGVGYAVITSVTRDDLLDKGLMQFAKVVYKIRENSDIPIELLTPDFMGNEVAADVISRLPIDVFGHNVETVPRLYRRVRSGADYRASLKLLKDVKNKANGKFFTKSSFMLGLGEGTGDVIKLLKDLKEAGCDIVTIGQYLRPANEDCLSVSEYISAERFEYFRLRALEIGIEYVLAGPFVRSSYKAREVFKFASQIWR